MYEMYPEWGPARHRTDEHTTDTDAHAAQRRPRYWERQLVTVGAPAGQDAESDRPDDN